MFVWNSLSFPVFCVIFPDFSSLMKISPDFSLSGNPVLIKNEK